MKPQIKIKNLSVTYFKGKQNEVRALENINLEIFPGEFVIFFGPSGCGKSTLMYSIAGLEKNTDGNIFIDGQEISDMSLREFETYHQKKIGMIFQAFYLISSLSVLKNVMLPQIAIGAKKQDRKKKAEELLKYFGVEAQKNKLPEELSGGQQQRVAISRSLINDPDIIFADEPVGNLDSKSADDVMEFLQKLNTEQKKTIILVTHDDRHLDMADRVFYLKDGKHQETKINKKVLRRRVEFVPELKAQDMLQRSYGKLEEAEDNVALEYYKAKNIVMEILVGLSMDEVEGLQERIDQLLSSGSGNYEAILRYLDKNSREGGLDMDVRRAKHLADKFGKLAKIIHTFNLKKGDVPAQAEEIAEYLYTDLEIARPDTKADALLKKLIIKRINNDIDRAQFQEVLDRPTKKGGAGMDIRIAHKLARRMELLMLGKYQLMTRTESKKLELIDR